MRAELDGFKAQLGDARKRFEGVLAKDPKNVQALLAVADLRARAGGTTEEVAGLIGKVVAPEATSAVSTKLAATPVLTRVWGLTANTPGSVMLAPLNRVPPPVALIVMLEPVWFAPLMLLAVAAEAGCVETFWLMPKDRPRESTMMPELNCLLILSPALNNPARP